MTQNNAMVTIKTKRGLTAVIQVRQMSHDKPVIVGQKSNSLGYPGGIVMAVRKVEVN